MSLTVPITNSQMQSGISGFSPPPSTGYAQSSMLNTGPTVNASVGTESNHISFSAAGWIIFAVLLLFALDQWGFQFAHVPV